MDFGKHGIIGQLAQQNADVELAPENVIVEVLILAATSAQAKITKQKYVLTMTASEPVELRN